MKLLQKISFEQVMLTWLTTEWYNRRYDGVRSFINPATIYEQYDKEAADLHVKSLLFIERHTILKHLPLTTTTWYKAKLLPGEFEKLNLINEATWFEMLREQRNLAKAAHMVAHKGYNYVCSGSHGHIQKINEICGKLKDGDTAFPEPLILVKKKGTVKATIIEGNHRALSFLLASRKYKKKFIPKEVIIGISPDMNKCFWHKI